MEPVNDPPTQTVSARITRRELERVDREAARLDMNRSHFLRHCTLIGLQEVERASRLIESPVVGALLQIFADLGPQETAEEFARIRRHLQGTDDSDLQNKFPFVNDPDENLGIDCGLGSV